MNIIKKLLLLGIFVISIFVYPINFSVDSADVKDISKLIWLIKQSNSNSSLTIKAMRRLGSLYKIHYLNLTKKEKEIIDTLSLILKKQSNNASIRKESCITLQYFENSEYAHLAIQSLREVIMKDKNTDVSTACVYSLSQYPRKGRLASRALLKKFTIDLKHARKQKITKDNIKMAKAIIKALATLKQKQAFIPLMKIIQSSYPVSVKRLAENAIEKINWD